MTAKLKLVTTNSQRRMLLKTMESANQAANAISQSAWESSQFRRYPLHHLVYRDIRDSFKLGAQMTVRVIAKVSHAYKIKRGRRRQFRKHGAISYDERMLSYQDNQHVSIWTLKGRLMLPYQAGKRQLELLSHRKGESYLAYLKGTFYLLASCEVPEPALKQTSGCLGIDLGIEVIAADSDGCVHAGEKVNERKKGYREKRAELQRVGTQSAKQLLKKRGGRERRFQRQVNHEIGKAIVAKAERTNRAIIVENLKGIRLRVRGFKPIRAALHRWSFADLQSKIRYKAKLVGIPVRIVGAAFTSQRCPQCGSVTRANRVSRGVFRCLDCSFSGQADVVAAMNLAAKGAVNAPHVGGL